MIELPKWARRGSAHPRFIDMGFTQRGISVSERINRKGSRYALDCTMGPFYPEQAREMVSRLIRGKQEGIRVPFPLLHSQGTPGLAVVDGAVSTGRVLNLRNVTVGYPCKSGFWLSIEKEGQHFLHNVSGAGRADDSGNLQITLNEMIRAYFADGAAVHLAKPMIEGLVDGDEWEWQYSVDRCVPIRFSIEERQ